MAYTLKDAYAEDTYARPRPEARHRPRRESAHISPLASSQARLRFALIFSIGLVALLSFVVFPAERLTIRADGESITVLSREQEPAALLELAGIRREAGDVLIQSGGELWVERAVPAIVEVDGRTIAWRTRATSVQTLLDELGVEVNAYDTVFYNGIAATPASALPGGLISALGPERGVDPATVVAADPVRIILTVARAVPITVVEDGLPISIKSSRPTLAAALGDAGIRLGPADEVYPSPSSPVVAGMEVEIKHAKAINLRTGDSTRVIYTHLPLLSDALAEAGLDLGPEDRVEPSLAAAVAHGMSARLVRGAGRVFVERDPVASKTVFRPDEGLSGSDARRVQGSDGVRFREYRIVIEDGVETEKTVLREWMDPPIIDTVIYHAASTTRATGQDVENLNIASTIHAWVTWYNAASSGKAATHPAYGITYSGVPLARGLVAVDPTVIPLGTRMYIPGYGFAVAADTGGGIKGNMVDLGYPDGVEVDWATGWADVYILAP